MRRFLKVLPLTLALVLALAGMGLVLTSCNNGSQAQIRFVHAIYDAGALDIEFNGAKDITDVAFFNYQPTSGYRPVPAGSDTVEGFATGTTTEAFETDNVSLSAGSEYTVVATGNIAGGGNGNVVILNPSDDNTEPANGTVNIRIIYAAPQGPGTVYAYIIQNPPVGQACQGAAAATLTYPGISIYIPEPYNTNGEGYTVYLCNAPDGNPLENDSQGYSFTAGSISAGSIRTLIFTDNSGGTYVNLPQPIILNDLN
jgi:hypothetical protein